MIDKRKFHYFLNSLKDENDNYIELIEAVQDKFEDEITPISKDQIRALRQHPLQYVKKVSQDKGEWTSQLHIWAEQGVPEILDLDPIYLAFKNSSGDSVLMSLVVASTGTYTEKINYDLIKKILDTDLSYVVTEKDDDGNEKVEDKNVLDVTDLNGQTIIDFLIDFAFGTGTYKNYLGDERLKKILREFSDASDKVKEQPEDISEIKIPNKKDSTEVEVEDQTDQNP